MCVCVCVCLCVCACVCVCVCVIVGPTCVYINILLYRVESWPVT